jgi:hemolysin activation/secretion protein
VPLKPGSVLAFQLQSSFSFGDVPLGELSALGGHEMMRGYYEGRYLDNHLLAIQAEYRFRLWDRLGAVIFAGGGDVASDVGDFRLGNLRPSVGAGLRFLIDKTEDLNLRFDYGIGYRTRNYYLQVAEAF